MSLADSSTASVSAIVEAIPISARLTIVRRCPRCKLCHRHNSWASPHTRRCCRCRVWCRGSHRCTRCRWPRADDCKRPTSKHPGCRDYCRCNPRRSCTRRNRRSACDSTRHSSHRNHRWCRGCCRCNSPPCACIRRPHTRRSCRTRRRRTRCASRVRSGWPRSARCRRRPARRSTPPRTCSRPGRSRSRSGPSRYRPTLHPERSSRRPERARRRLASDTPFGLPGPGVFADHDSTATPALLPDGSPARTSVAAALRDAPGDGGTVRQS